MVHPEVRRHRESILPKGRNVDFSTAILETSFLGLAVD